jgi:hypothetical protein
MRVCVSGLERGLTSLIVTSLILSISTEVRAQTSISASQNAPVSTSSAGDVTIVSGGSVNVGGGAAVTIDSSNSVANQGAIAGNDGQITGILVNSGGTGTITNSSTITITDSTLATTIPLTAGENRYGIQINAPSPFIGTITNDAAGTITVRGNNSAGIYLNQGGLTGSIVNAGIIGITGNNSFGILTNPNAPITGGISITNVITALGTGSGGLQLNGAVGGQLYIDSTVRADGYFNNSVTVARPADFTGLTANNFLQGGPAVAIANNVTGGIFVDTAGVVVSYGSAPALQVAPATGSAEIGAGSSGYGLVVDGSIRANGIYDNFSASTIRIGGAGGTAAIDGGIDITGKVLATAYAANATGISVLAGGSLPNLVNSGSIQSVVNFGQGANVAVGGNATAILADGGALAAITNTGTISATSANGRAVALDLTGDTVPVTITQAPSGTATASSITGDVLFGAAGATLNLDGGSVAGAVSYGASTFNALTIDHGAVLGGPLTQAPGGALALDIVNGRLASTSATALTLSSLTIGSKGEVDFAVNPATGQSGSATVVGAVMISSGAKIGLNLDSRLTAPALFNVIQTSPSAGTLVGQPSLLLGDLPYFYSASVVTNTSLGTIALDVRNRTFAEAGVQGSASAYNAVFGASYNDPAIRDAFNGAGTQQAFKHLYNQMLPSYSGGLFEMLSQGADAIVRTQSGNPVIENGTRNGGWAQQFGFGAEQSTGSAPGYHGGGLGFAFGWETPASSISTWGVSVSYMRATVDDFDTGPDNHEVGTVYAAGLYWREIDGGFRTDASVNAGVAELNGERNFAGTDLTGAAVSRTADAAWTGGMANAHLGLSYEEPIGSGFFVKPSLTGDYFVLYEGSRAEHNGGTGFDLNVASGTGKQGSVVGGLAFGMQLGDRDFTWRPEIMVGYKQVFGGPDDVVAQFAGGSSFSIASASQQGGAIAHIGIHGGNKYSDFAFEAGGEDRGQYRALDGRLVARFQF